MPPNQTHPLTSGDRCVFTCTRAVGCPWTGAPAAPKRANAGTVKRDSSISSQSLSHPRIIFSMSESKLAMIGILFLLSSVTYGQAKKPSVLLPASAAQSVSHFCSRAGIPKVSGSWHPTQTELERLESHLMRILKSGDELKQVQIVQLAGFYRQYIPIVVGGRKLIYINAFSWTPASYWQEHIMDRCDTGPSGWGVLYEPRTGQFSHLRTNAMLVPPPPR